MCVGWLDGNESSDSDDDDDDRSSESEVDETIASTSGFNLASSQPAAPIIAKQPAAPLTLYVMPPSKSAIPPTVATDPPHPQFGGKGLGHTIAAQVLSTLEAHTAAGDQDAFDSDKEEEEEEKEKSQPDEKDRHRHHSKHSDKHSKKHKKDKSTTAVATSEDKDKSSDRHHHKSSKHSKKSKTDKTPSVTTTALPKHQKVKKSVATTVAEKKSSRKTSRAVSRPVLFYFPDLPREKYICMDDDHDNATKVSRTTTRVGDKGPEWRMHHLDDTKMVCSSCYHRHRREDKKAKDASKEKKSKSLGNKIDPRKYDIPEENEGEIELPASDDDESTTTSTTTTATETDAKHVTSPLIELSSSSDDQEEDSGKQTAAITAAATTTAATTNEKPRSITGETFKKGILSKKTKRDENDNTPVPPKKRVKIASQLPKPSMAVQAIAKDVSKMAAKNNSISSTSANTTTTPAQPDIYERLIVSQQQLIQQLISQQEQSRMQHEAMLRHLILAVSRDGGASANIAAVPLPQPSNTISSTAADSSTSSTKN